jgi:hypothetical protein
VAIDSEKHPSLLGVVKGVIQPCNRPRRVAKCGMGGDVLDSLAVDVNGSPITQAFEIAVAG